MFAHRAMSPPGSRPDRNRAALDLRTLLGVGGLITVSCMLVGLLLVATLLIARVTHHEQQDNERSVRYASAVAAASLDAKGAANDERGFLISADPKFAGEARRRVAAARAWLRTAAVAAHGTAQRRAIADARSGFELWTTAIANEFAAYRADTAAASLGTTRALRKHYEANLARAQALAANAIHSTDASVTATSTHTIAILLVCIVLAVIAGAGTACWIIFSGTVPIAGVVRI